MFFFLSSAVQMMAHPGAIAGVPVGLEYLTQVDQLICKQIVELFEGLFIFSSSFEQTGKVCNK